MVIEQLEKRAACKTRKNKWGTLFFCLTLLHHSGNLSAGAQPHHHLTHTINLKYQQCPRVLSIYFPQSRIQDYYIFLAAVTNTHAGKATTLSDAPLRPFSFEQQNGIFELFDVQGITAHYHDLTTMVRLTQRKEFSELTPLQQGQARDWREMEGSVVTEKTCRNNSVCKERTIKALQKMGMYNALYPLARTYDFTLFLGGSIQEMQLRMLVLLSVFAQTLDDPKLDLGEIVALTCDRQITKEEIAFSHKATMFDVYSSEDGGSKAFINPTETATLTETTAYLAIYQSIRQICTSDAYFQRFKETSTGYHPFLPTSFLSDNSIENELYSKQGYTYQLSDKLPEIACKFLERYPEPVYYDTPQQLKGASRIQRPTTKKTVKQWLSSQQLPIKCKKNGHCKFLAISNAPNAMYQHLAVLQGLEDTLVSPKGFFIQLSTAASAASTDIPTNSLLDNLTKILYLEDRHPYH